MKVRVKFSISDRDIDEVVEGDNSGTILDEAKERVIREVGWKGVFLRAMSSIQFAQLVVAKYNEHYGSSFELPQTADDFIRFGLATGNVEILGG